MMAKCPICGKVVKDILKHIAIEHEISSVHQYENELLNLEKERKKQEEFATLVNILNEQKAKGLISAGEWRSRVEDWLKEQKRSSATN
jgi:hypothetical protein